MSKLSLEQTRDFKILLSQAKGLEKTIDDTLNRNAATEIGKYSSYKQMAIMYNDLTSELKAVTQIPAHYYTYDIDKMPGIFDTTWLIQKEVLESVLASTRMLIAIIEGNLEFVYDEIENLDNFISQKLRSAIYEPPKIEKEVQNAIELLLIGKGMNKGIDYDRETGKFTFSGREYIPDFIIYKLNLCIEVKLIKDVARKSKVIEEINADITAYSKTYENIIFVVYDLGYIRDETEFKRDIENSGNIKVVIIKS